MSWSGGQDVFDCVVDSLQNLHDYITLPQHSEEDYFKSVLSPLLVVLDNQDWDNHSESNYWTHPVIGKILGNTFEEEG